VDEALVQLDEAIRLEPPSAFTGVGLGFKLLNRAYAEKRDELSALLDEAWPHLPEKIPAGVGPVITLMGAAQAVAILGLTEHAAKLYDRVDTATDHWVHTWFDGALTHRIAGMIAALLERWDDAEEHFRTALRQVDELPNRLDAPRVHYWYARMLLDRGAPDDLPKARELLVKALEGYRRIGMPLHVGWTEERLAALS
jgi:tetratricopeptide (TPR) repeat protein